MTVHLSHLSGNTRIYQQLSQIPVAQGTFTATLALLSNTVIMSFLPMTVNYCLLASDTLKCHSNCAHQEHDLMATPPIVDLLRTATLSISEMPLLSHWFVLCYLYESRVSWALPENLAWWAVLRSSIINPSSIFHLSEPSDPSSILCCKSPGISALLTIGHHDDRASK